MKDLFGKALLDYYQNSFIPPLLLHNEYGPPEIIPIERYFIEYEEYPELEVFALQQVRGKILDIGSATGRHVLHLQDLGLDVSALDFSETCGKLMKDMGVEQIITDDIFSYKAQQFDTISMLMNGIGIAGNIKRLEQLLIHLKSIIKPSGQLIIDSSDISYLYEEKDIPSDKYFGELAFHYEYKGMIDDPFQWLYIDQNKLAEVAHSTGWVSKVIFEDEADAYLAILQKN